MPIREEGYPTWTQRGNVMCVEVRTPEEDGWLRMQSDVVQEEALLNRHLARNHSILVLSGIAQDIMNIDRHTYEDAALAAREDVTDFHDISGDEAEHMIMQDGPGPIEITSKTEFRVGENLLEEEPCDPTIAERELYVVIWNGPDDYIPHAVGTKYVGAEGEEDEFDPAVKNRSGDLWLSERKLAVVDALLDPIKQDIANGRLPRLGLSGRYDTLVVAGLDADPAWDYAADAEAA
ncbi:MAG TPA: hypothetical protein VD706_00355 [Candidatus Saccharimonadales bacterium]|nr:hypothetical protein [Candidatus Saccharimonadales bacterium]